MFTLTVCQANLIRILTSRTPKQLKAIKEVFDKGEYPLLTVEDA